MRLADNLAAVLAASAAARPVAARIVLDGLVMRIELLKRFQKVGLAGLVLADDAGQLVSKLDQARILNVAIFENAKGVELHSGVLSIEICLRRHSVTLAPESR